MLTNRKCVYTFMGHNQAVKDIAWTCDGKRFISAGYDRVIQLWDAEVGKVVRSFTTKKLPFCCTFHPDEDKQNVFLVGSQGKKII